MKKVLSGLGLVAVGAGLFGLGWISHAEFGGAPASPSVANSAPVNPGISLPPQQAPAQRPPMVPPSPPLSNAEFEHLRAVHEAVLKANPDLDKEYKQLLGALQAEKGELKAAMIKADPKVAPIIAKIDAQNKLIAPPSASPATSNHP